jgi:acyl dehydratase
MTSMLYQVNRYALDGDPEHGFPLNFGFNKLRFVTPVNARWPFWSPL